MELSSRVVILNHFLFHGIFAFFFSLKWTKHSVVEELRAHVCSIFRRWCRADCCGTRTCFSRVNLPPARACDTPLPQQRPLLFSGMADNYALHQKTLKTNTLPTRSLAHDEIPPREFLYLCTYNTLRKSFVFLFNFCIVNLTWRAQV